MVLSVVLYVEIVVTINFSVDAIINSDVTVSIVVVNNVQMGISEVSVCIEVFVNQNQKKKVNIDILRNLSDV